MRLDHASLAFAILLVLTDIVKTSLAENKVMREQRAVQQQTGAPNGSVPQNICSSCKFLLAGRCGRNNSPWKESVAGKKIIQGVRGDLKSRIAATGYLYGLLTTQDLNCAL